MAARSSFSAPPVLSPLLCGVMLPQVGGPLQSGRGGGAAPVWGRCWSVRVGEIRARSAGAGGPAGGGVRGHPKADLEAFVSQCAGNIGRDCDAALIRGFCDTLEQNWYCAPSDLAALTAEDAAAMKLPGRLAAEIRAQLVRGHQGEGEAGEALVLQGKAGVALPQALESAFGEGGQGEGGAVDKTPRMRKGQSTNFDEVRVTSRKASTRYRLKQGDISQPLRKELDALARYLTKPHLMQQERRVKSVTAAKYEDVLCGLLGWLHHIEGVPLEDLSLSLAFPSPERASAETAFQHTQWLFEERGCAPSTVVTALRGCIAAAKYLYHGSLDLKGQDKRQGAIPYSEIPLVQELRKLTNDAKAAMKVAPPVADEGKKWMTWPEFVRCAERLYLECAPLRHGGGRRTPSAVAWSMQKFLIFSIFACVPDRQRTIRELAVGTTLKKDGNTWYISHGPDDYKTGREYGARPPLVISSHIYPALEDFIANHRPALVGEEEEHPFLFSQKNGRPFTDVTFYRLFTTTAYRLTGKRTNPHLVRDMIVTHLRSGDASEKQLEALAIYMGHSLTEQKRTYDRRTKAEKVAPAVALLQQVNFEAGAASGGGGGDEAAGGGAGAGGPEANLARVKV